MSQVVISACDWLFEFADVGDLTDLDNLIFAIKNRPGEPDSESMIYIDLGGLLISNGAAYATPEDGAIIITDDAAGTGRIVVRAAATLGLPAGTKYAALKRIKAAGVVRNEEIWRPPITVMCGVVATFV